jgi:hypothetical protein
MPTQILRPDATTSQTGMNPASNIHTVIGDDDDGTAAFQSNSTANYTCTFDDTSGLSGATIDKFVFSFRALQDRRAGATVTVQLQGTSGAYSNFVLGGSGFTTTLTTYDSSEFTTQDDGSTALDASYLDSLRVLITPSTEGHRVTDMFVTVTYQEAGYGNTVAGVSDISEVVGIDAANISQVAGV